MTANGQAANKANACGTLAPLSLPLAAWDGQPEKARAHGTLTLLSGELAA
jgi:hypothetical protein